MALSHCSYRFLKGNYTPSPNWALHVQNIVLINNSRTAWPIKIFMLLQDDAYTSIISQNSIDNLEIVHKIRTHRQLYLRQTSKLCTHNERPETMDQKYERIPIFRTVGGNRSARRKPTKAGMESANQIHIQPLASRIGERKVFEHKPTRLATGVVYHPDTEQNRPYKIPWPWRGLNQGPTAPQARTLPLCHTTPITLPM